MLSSANVRTSSSLCCNACCVSSPLKSVESALRALVMMPANMPATTLPAISAAKMIAMAAIQIAFFYLVCHGFYSPLFRSN